MSWTQEKTELAVKLWNEGKSATEIAERCGGGVTRNAVIGKIHRIQGANQRQPRPPRAARVPAPPRAKPSLPAMPKAERLPRARSLVLAPPPVRRPRPRPALRLVDTSPMALLPFMELGKDCCKWPVTSDAPFKFCGRKVCADRAPYCAEHTVIAGVGYSDPAKRIWR